MRNNVIGKQGCRYFVVLALCAWLYGQDAPHSGINGLSAQSVSKALQSAGTDAAIVRSIEADLSAKDYAQAESKLVAQIEGNAHTRNLLEVLGGVFFLDSKFLDSAVAFKKAEKYGPLTEGDRFTLAMSYIELKRNGWAREELVSLSKNAPGNPLYLYWLGRLDYDGQRFTDSKENFQRTIQVDPRFVRAYDGLGLCEEALGNLSAAEETYKQANILNREQGSHFAWPALNYGTLLRKSSRYEQARVLLNEALRINPSLSKAFYERGRLEASVGDRHKALEDFQKAFTLDTKDSSPLYWIFRLYKELGQTELAARTLAQFHALKSQSY